MANAKSNSAQSAGSLAKQLVAEFLGTATLLYAVVGSGIFAQSLSEDVGIQVLINATSIGLALAALIWIFVPISGAHFNPVVTLAAVLNRHIPPFRAFGYIIASTLGAIVGTIFANVTFGLTAVQLSTNERATVGTFSAEVFATAALVMIIQLLGARGQSNLAPLVIGGWIMSAIYFTSSTSFVNPAVTIARMLTDTLTGINPISALMFVGAQLIGLPIGIVLGRWFSKGSN
jgi:glycerol uptake facilitator-like aquaporin